MTVALWIVVGLQAGVIVALAVLLGVSRRSLGKTRRALRRSRDGESPPRRRRRAPLDVAPLAIKTVANTVATADAIVRRQITRPVRSSIEDLAGWARIEKPNLGRITADGRVVLMFSDIEGSTARNASLGDEGWVGVLDRHEELVQRSVTEHRGVVVKNQGDGFMIAFGEPLDALRCGVEVQHELSSARDGISVRIGAHIGTSVRRGDDLFGLDVATAARVADLADGGEILVSEALRRAVGDDVRFGPPREVELKGLDGPQTVFAVDLD